jgi:hypothetical protein
MATETDGSLQIVVDQGTLGTPHRLSGTLVSSLQKLDVYKLFEGVFRAWPIRT